MASVQSPRAPRSARPARRRTILTVIALLLAWGAAGAALNVAVAWGLAAFTNVGDMGDRDNLAGWLLWDRPHGIWEAYRTEAWGTTYVEHDFRPGDFGSDFVGTEGDEPEFVIPSWTGVPLSSELSERNRWPLERRQLCAFGWPVRTLWYEFNPDSEDEFTCHGWGTRIVGAIRLNREVRGSALPLRPLWPGFAINTVFYAGVLGMLFCGPSALRRMIRRRRGQCAHCAYPMGQSPVCTECGAAVFRTSS